MEADLLEGKDVDIGASGSFIHYSRYDLTPLLLQTVLVVVLCLFLKNETKSASR